MTKIVIRFILTVLISQYGTKEDEREATIEIFLKELNKEISILIRGIKNEEN